MNGTDNGDGTFTCKLKDSGMKNGYSAATAPVVMPIETPGYYAAEALSENTVGEYMNIILEQIAEYTSQGFVFVYPGCRGIDHGAPTGVTDLKAAIRYVRYSDDVLAGDAEKIFVYGTSGGGAQSAILVRPVSKGDRRCRGSIGLCSRIDVMVPDHRSRYS